MNPTDSRCILFDITYKYANPNGFRIYVGFQFFDTKFFNINP